MSFTLSPLLPPDHEAVARLLHASLHHWYESRLRQGARFGDKWEPFLIFPQTYEVLDPGQAVAAREEGTGRLWGVCFIHPRETHVSVGIVATCPEAAGRGVARAMMNHAAGLARERGQPLRLVSSLLNLDSFSLYSRMGFVPHTLYQDVFFQVPEQGLPGAAPEEAARVRPARFEDIPAMAALEEELLGIRRERDLRFFLENPVGDWRCAVLERPCGLGLAGWLAGSVHPSFLMTGPGVARDEVAAKALLWAALEAQRGGSTVVLAPCQAPGLVQTLYQWGGRNVELHAAQVLGPLPQASGLAFPTFLPESA